MISFIAAGDSFLCPAHINMSGRLILEMSGRVFKLLEPMMDHYDFYPVTIFYGNPNDIYTWQVYRTFTFCTTDLKQYSTLFDSDSKICSVTL
jgi:hypothetical protein